ncbi:MAG: ribonuclease III [Gammaproteobacteria bacterium]
MNEFVGLYRQLGYRFNDNDLLVLALTHRSLHGRQNNERLEFLGDSILNLVVAQALFDAFGQAREGQLSRLRADLVSGASLALVAREIGLGHYIRLGTGELKSGGFRRDSILADALEALIGALYLDAGMEQCRDIVLSWFAERIKGLDLKLPKDAKTRLQELLQSKRLSLPIYQVVSAVGQPHDQTFYVACSVPQMDVVGQGEGGSRRRAEQVAAQAVLDQLEAL